MRQKAAKIISVFMVALLVVGFMSSSGLDVNALSGGPAPPENFTVAADGTTAVELRWDENWDVAGYRVYRSTSEKGSYDLLAELEDWETSYRDEQLVADTAYYYKLAALGASGLEGKATEPLVYAPNGVLPQDSGQNSGTENPAPNDPGESQGAASPPPAANGPVGPRATVGTPSGLMGWALGSDSAMLVWNSVVNVDGYILYYATSDVGPYVELGRTQNTAYTAEGLQSGTTYYFKVSAYKDGEESSLSDYYIVATDGFKLNPPSRLRVTAQSTSTILVEWDASNNASGYYVYRARTQDQDPYTYVGYTLGTEYLDENLDADTVYWYKVTAYDAQTSEESVPVGPQQDRTFPLPLDAPMNLEVVATGTHTIDVSWDAVSGADGYVVTRSLQYNGTYTQVATTQNLNITDDTCDPDTVYWYKVVAYKGTIHNVGAEAGPKSAKTWPLLTAPLNLTATVLGPTSVRLNWNAVDTAEKYNVYWTLTPNDPSSFALAGSVNAPTTTFNHLGLTPNRTYWYYVKAERSDGESPESNLASATPTEAIVVQVSNPTDSTLDVVWSPATGATSYTVTRGTDGVNFPDVVRSNYAGTAFQDTGLNEKTIYYYRVVANNGPQGTGSGKTLQTLTVTVDNATESSLRISWNTIEGAIYYTVYRGLDPNNITTNLGNYVETSIPNYNLAENTRYYYRVVANNGPQGTGSGKTLQKMAVVVDNATETSLRVSWTSIDGATSYTVTRGTDGVNFPDAVGAFTSTSINNTGLTPNTTYYYKVVANTGPNAIGNGKTTQNMQVTVDNATISSLRVNWTPVNGATSYTVYRGTDGSSFPTYVGTYSTTSTTNTGLAPNTLYYYRVTANNGPQGVGSGKTWQQMVVTVNDATQTSLRVSWTSIDGASSYTVTRGTDGVNFPVSVGTYTATNITNTGLAANTTYYYRVVANTGPNGTGSGKTLPNLYVTVDNATQTSLRVGWTSIPGATSYTVYRGTDGTSFLTNVGTFTGTSTTNTNLTPNTLYYYRVTANNGPQGIGSGKTQPQSMTVTTSNHTENSMRVNWNAITGATNYTIYRGTQNGSYPTYVGQTTSTYIDSSGLTASTQYYYRVTANGPGVVGYGDGTTKSSTQTLEVRVTDPTETSLKVSWTAINGASSYTVYRGTTSGSQTYVVGTYTVTSITNSGLNADTTYYYRVVANTGQVGVGNGKTDAGYFADLDFWTIEATGQEMTINFSWRNVARPYSEYQFWISTQKDSGFQHWATINPNVSGATIGELYRTFYYGALESVNNSVSKLYIRNLQSGTRYYVRMKAGNSSSAMSKLSACYLYFTVGSINWWSPPAPYYHTNPTRATWPGMP